MGLTTVKLPEREKLENWTTIIPAVSDNYVPCNQTTIPVSEVCISSPLYISLLYMCLLHLVFYILCRISNSNFCNCFYKFLFP